MEKTKFCYGILVNSVFISARNQLRKKYLPSFVVSQIFVYICNLYSDK